MADRERDDARTSIPLDPEEALKALLRVDPEAEPVEDAKQAALARLRAALPAELALSGHQDALVEAARRADASWDEIKEALEKPR